MDSVQTGDEGGNNARILWTGKQLDDGRRRKDVKFHNAMRSRTIIDLRLSMHWNSEEKEPPGSESRW